MRQFRLIALLGLLTGLMLASCKKESDNPSATSLSVQVQATNKTFSLLKSASLVTPAFAWDTCFMNISKIELEGEKHSSEMSNDMSEVHFEWLGPKKVDLFNLTSVIGEINLQPGVYDEVSINIKAFQADAGNSPVFYLTGVYTNNADNQTPIVILINEDLNFKVKKEGSVMDGITDYTSLVKIDLNLLMTGITSAELDGSTLTNGKILITKTANNLLYNKILANVSMCTKSEFKHGNGGEQKTDSGKDNSSSDKGYNY